MNMPADRTTAPNLGEALAAAAKEQCRIWAMDTCNDHGREAQGRCGPCAARAALHPDAAEQRWAAARARAEWELGDASWAGVIVNAFLHPEDDTANLEGEKET